MEPLDEHLGHMPPKDWILEAFGTALGAQDGQFGSNSVCCARTAALQGGYEKQKVKASRDFLQQLLHHVPKSLESYAKNVFFSRVRHVSKFIKHRKNCGFVA